MLNSNEVLNLTGQWQKNGENSRYERNIEKTKMNDYFDAVTNNKSNQGF